MKALGSCLTEPNKEDVSLLTCRIGKVGGSPTRVCSPACIGRTNDVYRSGSIARAQTEIPRLSTQIRRVVALL